jgi:hypothetical protein
MNFNFAFFESASKSFIPDILSFNHCFSFFILSYFPRLYSKARESCRIWNYKGQ